MPDFQISEAGLEWLANSPDSPVADVVDRAAERLLEVARALAPVSARGSKHAPPGFTKANLSKSDEQHEDGSLCRFVGTRTNRHGGGYPYPLAFISNDAGVTWNRGHNSARSAADRFLAVAEELCPYVIEDV